MHLLRSAVLGLAPRGLSNHRARRYTGADQAIANAAFRTEDRASFGVVYRFLAALEIATANAAALDVFLAGNDLAVLASRLGQIGRDGGYQGAVAAAVHDLRGGVFSALILELSAPSNDRMHLDSLHALTRDCSKQMRNLLADIDPAGRERDLELRYHSLAELVAAMRSYQGSTKSGRVTLTLDGDESATIASSCTEFGTIERVAFNLLENAATHASTRDIEASLVPMDEDLRVVVSNVMSAESSAEILAMLEQNPALFYSSFSSTGSGIGLQVAATLVGRAYGIDEIAELVARGYVGTTIVENAFVSWFHWPLARRNPDDPAPSDCDCR